MALAMAKTVRARGNSLPVQWLGLRASTAEGTDSTPGQGTKIPPKKKKKKVRALNRISYYPNSPSAKAMCLLFEGMGFAHPKL